MTPPTSIKLSRIAGWGEGALLDSSQRVYIFQAGQDSGSGRGPDPARASYSSRFAKGGAPLFTLNRLISNRCHGPFLYGLVWPCKTLHFFCGFAGPLFSLFFAQMSQIGSFCLIAPGALRAIRANCPAHNDKLKLIEQRHTPFDFYISSGLTCRSPRYRAELSAARNGIVF
jgi:hypothetical protein